MKSIITLTLNPCIDMSSNIEEVTPEVKLRCSNPQYDPGGGGINVSRVIKILGGDSLAIYCSGGPLGSLLEELLDREGIERKPIKIEGWTRQNITIYENKSNRQFRFGMPGPSLLKSEGQQCRKFILSVKPPPKFVVVSGSIPQGLPNDFFSQLVEDLNTLGAKLIIDTSGDSLKAVLNIGVYLLKPNLREFADILNRKSIPDHELEGCCQDFINKGYCEVLILSLGAKGSILATSKEIIRIVAPKVITKSKIGAGDSMVGGVIFGLANNYSLYESAVLGVAAGTSTVMSEGTKLCTEKDVWRFFKLINEKNIKS